MKRKKIIVQLSENQMRLDRYVKSIYPNLTQGMIEKLIRNKDIKVNNIRQKANYMLKSNDEVEIYIPFEAQNETLQEQEFSPGSKALASKILSEYKIFQDENILAINKPSQLASQGGTNLSISIDEAINYLNKDISPSMVNDGYRICHRLDKSTSGVFLIACNRGAAQKITESFAAKTISKKYIAILSGVPKQDNGIVKNYLTKDVKNQIQVISNEGDYAETEYEVLAKNNHRSLVLFTPKTGRMHQIRVHAKSLGCPILGDKKYGHRKYLEQKTPFSNLFLHAFSLFIPEDVFARKYGFHAEIPQYFRQQIAQEFGEEILKILGNLK
ncbi:MAG: RluA family pseudouridine synthase [Rickettsiaceae bacterium]|nr:RluA family pseudouridine synthase [Rickettsiaceae bacterium]